MDDGKIIYVYLLYYSKTFDIINRQFIIAKLGKTLQLLSNYFSGRRQKVTLKSMLSYEPETGILRGAIFGPMFFSGDVAHFSNMSSD